MSTRCQYSPYCRCCHTELLYFSVAKQINKSYSWDFFSPHNFTAFFFLYAKLRWKRKTLYCHYIVILMIIICSYCDCLILFFRIARDGWCRAVSVFFRPPNFGLVCCFLFRFFPPISIWLFFCSLWVVLIWWSGNKITAKRNRVRASGERTSFCRSLWDVDGGLCCCWFRFINNHLSLEISFFSCRSIVCMLVNYIIR